MHRKDDPLSGFLALSLIALAAVVIVSKIRPRTAVAQSVPVEAVVSEVQQKEFRPYLIGGAFIGFLGYLLHCRESFHLIFDIFKPLAGIRNISEALGVISNFESNKIIVLIVSLSFIFIPVMALFALMFDALHKKRKAP